MGDRREKQTLIPAFDPEALARELEESERRPTITPAFDPTSYARMVEDQQAAGADTPRTMTAATPLLPVAMAEGGAGDETTATMGRAMYGSYLSSDYPEALVLAERVLERDPDHALAKLVVDGCHDRIGGYESRLSPFSVVRLVKQPFELVELVQEADAVLGAIDGVSDITMVAALAGIPRPEALDRLHALLALGIVEVVQA